MASQASTITTRQLRRAKHERKKRSRKRLYIFTSVTVVLVNVLVFASIAVFAPDKLVSDEPKRLCLEMAVVEGKETCLQWELNKTHRSTLINSE